MFLAGALALTTRRVVPAHMTSEALDARASARARDVVLCVMTLVAAASVLVRWWNDAPGYATTVLALLPVLLGLTVIDLDEHRLPNRLTLTCAIVTTLGLGLASVTADAGSDAARRAVGGALGLGLFYLVIALLGAGSGMGLGDVKLAPSLGALLAWPGWNIWAAGAFGAFVLGGAWGIVLIARGQGRSARMPFGPFMIAGALIAICLG